jgi:hypothetical protein
MMASLMSGHILADPSWHAVLAWPPSRVAAAGSRLQASKTPCALQPFYFSDDHIGIGPSAYALQRATDAVQPLTQRLHQGPAFWRPCADTPGITVLSFYTSFNIACTSCNNRDLSGARWTGLAKVGRRSVCDITPANLEARTRWMREPAINVVATLTSLLHCRTQFCILQVAATGAHSR